MNRQWMHEQLLNLTEQERELKKAYLISNGKLPRASVFPAKKCQSGHMSQADYQLDERKNVEVVKHTCYTSSPMHDHDFFEIAFAYQGSFHHHFLIDGKEKEVTLEECDLVIIPPGLRHRIAVLSDDIMLNILINRDTFRKVFFSKLPGNNLLYNFFTDILFSEKPVSYLLFRTGGDSKLKEIILDILLERQTPDHFTNAICDDLLNIFFLQVLRHPQARPMENGSGGTSESLLTSVLFYIDRNYTSFSLNEMADFYHFTPTYLNRIFKKFTGTTVLQYVKKMRMEEAKRLIENTGLSVEEIAETVGYSDVSYFIEQYKKEYNRTPIQARRKA